MLLLFALGTAATFVAVPIHPMTRALLGFLATLTLLGMAGGYREPEWVLHQSRPVSIENAAGVPIISWTAGRGFDGGRVELQPGQVEGTAWGALPPGELRRRATHRIEADNLSGIPIFCRIYTDPELDAFGWRFEITRGQIRCRIRAGERIADRLLEGWEGNIRGRIYLPSWDAGPWGQE